MTIFKLTAAALLLGGIALPAAAQVPAGADAPAAAGREGGHRGHGPMFASLSPAGQQVMRDAMTGGDRKASHAAIKAARDRMLTILDAPALDGAALKRAMDDERNLAGAEQLQRQTAMLAAFQKLTPADRTAFVADARAMRSRMDDRMRDWQARRGDRGGMAPPPPPPL